MVDTPDWIGNPPPSINQDSETVALRYWWSRATAWLNEMKGTVDRNAVVDSGLVSFAPPVLVLGDITLVDERIEIDPTNSTTPIRIARGDKDTEGGLRIEHTDNIILHTGGVSDPHIWMSKTDGTAELRSGGSGFGGGTSDARVVADKAAGTVSIVDGVLLHDAGTEAAPGIATINDSNTGFFSAGNGDYRFSNNGVERFKFTGADIVGLSTLGLGITQVNEIKCYGGTATDPSYTFEDNQQTGMYHIDATDHIGFTVNGNASFEITNSSQIDGLGSLAIIGLNEVQVSTGSQTDPSFTFTSDQSHGIYSSGANVYTTVGGAWRFGVLSSSILAKLSASASSATVVHNNSSTSTLYRFTSRRAYKTNIVDAAPPQGLLNSRVVNFNAWNDVEDLSLGFNTQLETGWIAEELGVDWSPGVIRDEEGNPETINQNAIIAGLTQIVQDQERRLLALEARVV